MFTSSGEERDMYLKGENIVMSGNANEPAKLLILFFLIVREK